VLLVEDEEAVLEFERDVLVGAGADVTTALSVDEMKDKLHSATFDVVVMNGRMPGGLSAQEIYLWMADKFTGMEERLLLTFSSVTDSTTRAFLQEHSVPSLVKPFEVADLISQVRGLTQKQSKRSTQTRDEKTASASAGA